MKIVKNCPSSITKRPDLNLKINKYAAKKKLQNVGDNKYQAYTINFQGSRSLLMIKTVAALVFSFGTAYTLSKKVRTWCEILKFGGKLVGMEKILSSTNSVPTSNTSVTHASTTHSFLVLPINYQFSQKDIHIIVNEAINLSAIPYARDRLNDLLKNLNTNDIELINEWFSDFENKRTQAILEKQNKVIIAGNEYYNLKNFIFSTDLMGDNIYVACHKINDTESTLGKAKDGPKISLTPLQINLLFGCLYRHVNGGGYLAAAYDGNIGKAYERGVRINK